MAIRKRSHAPAALQALADAAGAPLEYTDQQSLAARGRARQDLSHQQEEQTWERMGPGGDIAAPVRDLVNQRMTDLFNRRDIGGNQAKWGPFFEAIQEAGDRQGMASGIGDVEGLSAAPAPQGTVPLALQGLQNVAYGTSPSGRPTSLKYKRGY